MTALRLLVSARDPGAAQLVGAVVPALARAPGVSVRLLAQGAAVPMLREQGLDVVTVDIPALEQSDDAVRQALLARAQQALDDWLPHAVVVGLSGPGLGIDEALTWLCTDRPVIALQDYEGWVVEGFGRVAPDYLVADAHAARLTRRHKGLRTHEIGALKYVRYAALDVPALRTIGRKLLPLADTFTVITFYGQPAWDFDGYRDTLSQFITQAGRQSASLLGAIKWLYRAHPKESAMERSELVARFAAAGLDIAPCPAPDIDTSLAMTDAALTVFSSAAIDQVHLQRVSPKVLGAAWFLLMHPAIRARLSQDNGSEEPAVASQALAVCTRDQEEIGPTLAALVDGSLREIQALRISRAVASPAQAASRAAAVILAVASRHGETT